MLNDRQTIMASHLEDMANWLDDPAMILAMMEQLRLQIELWQAEDNVERLLNK